MNCHISLPLIAGSRDINATLTLPAVGGAMSLRVEVGICTSISGEAPGRRFGGREVRT